MNPLGRRVPPNFDHVVQWPLHALMAETLSVPPTGVEKSLGLPWWWKQHDQGVEGSCVGFGSSAMMSVTNHYQRLKTTGQNITYRYASRWLYQEAQPIDEWDDTPPAEGTSVNASCKILHTRGHRRIQSGKTGPELLTHGISAYRWAVDHNEIRAAIYGGLAVSIGVAWYSDFDDPSIVNGERWIGRDTNWGWVRGGHCVCLYRMSDRRQAFMMMNSWGLEYAPVWIPYATLDLLLEDYGEAVVITDR